MSTYLVTRHKGAAEWVLSNAAKYSVEIDRVIPHLDIELLIPGDVVVGTLPIQMVALLTELGVGYVHLSLTVTMDIRGMELTCEEMYRRDARLERFKVCRDEPE